MHGRLYFTSVREELLCGNVGNSFWIWNYHCHNLFFLHCNVENQTGKLAEQSEREVIWVIFWNRFMLQFYPVMTCLVGFPPHKWGAWRTGPSFWWAPSAFQMVIGQQSSGSSSSNLTELQVVNLDAVAQSLKSDWLTAGGISTWQTQGHAQTDISIYWCLPKDS